MTDAPEVQYTIRRRPGWGQDLVVSGATTARQAAEASRANLSRANLYGADLYGADLSGADLYGANLSRADLSGANLSRADLSGANLSRADLYGANLYGANLYGADLSGANLSRADLYGANLYGANLYGADLYGANLSRANLSGANLSGANLYGANLSRADLSGANLYGANLYGAKNYKPERTTALAALPYMTGTINAFKLVNERGEGHVNGGVKYPIGEVVREPKADRDPARDCGAGLNVADLPWVLREWREGYRVLLVEHTAADIAAIPHGTDGKYRVTRLTVLKDITDELRANGVFGEAVTTEKEVA